MKTTQLALLAAAAATASAAEVKQTGPFALQIVDSGNSSLNGQFLSSCHAGAAIEALCYSTASPEKPLTAKNAAQYYLNTTEGSSNGGLLWWNLPVGNGNVPSAMQLEARTYSDLSPAMFWPGADKYTPVYFDDAGKLHLKAPFDETKFAVFDRPTPSEVSLYQWEACWNNAGGYYYPTINWAVGTGHPRNPTCTAVNITKV